MRLLAADLAAEISCQQKKGETTSGDHFFEVSYGFLVLDKYDQILAYDDLYVLGTPETVCSLASQGSPG